VKEKFFIHKKIEADQQKTLCINKSDKKRQRRVFLKMIARNIYKIYERKRFLSGCFEFLAKTSIANQKSYNASSSTRNVSDLFKGN
jgi:hypothetical protein